jgi:hypothetical protein
VAEHLLHDLDVGAGGDGQRGRGVAQLVRLQAGPEGRRWPRRGWEWYVRDRPDGATCSDLI